MPPKKQLSDVELGVISKWIEGLPRLTTTPSAGLTKGKDHWAFQPIKQPTPPRPADAAWIKNPIDAFILAKLQDQQ